ncbi:MAG: P63C domain-containing protein [Phycisphaerales bacterium]|jgi:hypothetical protein|nr:P63C domain-containing protein [Phycisphaerales bacterium]
MAKKQAGAESSDEHLWASKGGKARAAKMTPSERSEIARRASEARWEKQKGSRVVLATHTGELRVVDPPIPCAVLEDGRRVLSETGMIEALGLYRSGAVHVRARDPEGGQSLPLFVANKNIQPFVEEDLEEVLRNPIWFRSGGSPTRQKGVDARVIPKICEVWLRARDAGVLVGKRQQAVAVKADILMRGLAEVGTVALVDEATGYQRERAQDALATILQAFVAKELQKWVKTFPLEFYELICEVREDPIERAYNRPAYFGKLTNNLVYERLAPGVLEELQTRNPVQDDGRRKHRHHQLLTPDLGHPKLREHLAGVMTTLRAARALNIGWGGFKKLIDKTHPKQPKLPLFDHSED